jgi:hypothetical protein
MDEKNNLTELLDSSYPLLQTLRDICPGTYKHSQSVASMIERVSDDLSLDVPFTKVSAMYHDIGKIIFPKCFIENQTEKENIHDGLDPRISYYLITKHVSDSVNILINDENFPRKIIEIISQHHGTTVVRYFFSKSGLEDEKAFRYSCCKPKSIESALLMICDHIEAISRSEIQVGKFDPNKVIDSTINNLLNDGQLDDVSMKLGLLRTIKTSLTKELEGTYHKRIDYENT